MDNRCESEIINYKIISDYEKLNSFIELLPDNNKDERYMLYLFARKKYNHIEGLAADKCQLKRIMCHKNPNFKQPDLYAILCCLTKYDPGTFEDFCGDFGYDEDSRKVYKIYQAVKEEYMNMCSLFNDKELELLSLIN